MCKTTNVEYKKTLIAGLWCDWWSAPRFLTMQRIDCSDWQVAHLFGSVKQLIERLWRNGPWNFHFDSIYKINLLDFKVFPWTVRSSCLRLANAQQKITTKNLCFFCRFFRILRKRQSMKSKVEIEKRVHRLTFLSFICWELVCCCQRRVKSRWEPMECLEGKQMLCKLKSKNALGNSNELWSFSFTVDQRLGSLIVRWVPTHFPAKLRLSCAWAKNLQRSGAIKVIDWHTKRKSQTQNSTTVDVVTWIKIYVSIQLDSPL